MDDSLSLDNFGFESKHDLLFADVYFELNRVNSAIDHLEVKFHLFLNVMLYKQLCCMKK